MRYLVKITLVFSLLFTILLVPSRVFAEEIDNYQIDIKVNKNSQIDITETIHYNFGSIERHGIFREIPFTTTNKEGQKYKLDLNNIKVTDKNGQTIQYSKSNENLHTVLKIGDPNKTISGLNTYIISYSVNGAVTYFSDHDELYWNAIGADWQIPINKASINIDFSATPEFEISRQNIVCYTGPSGSTEHDCSISVNSNKVSIIANNTLMPYEGITFAVSMLPGTLERHDPEIYEEFDPTIIFIIIFLLNILLVPVIIAWWYFKGRDPKDDRVIVRMYDSPKDPDGKEMTPLELGTIIDETTNPRDISAEIINMAVNKYITIKEDEKKKVSIDRGPKLIENPNMTTLKRHQADILEALGLDTKESVDLSKHSDSIAKKIAKMREALMKKQTEQGYFAANPWNTRTKYFGLGFVMPFIGLFLPALAMLIIAYFMPKKTQLGVEVKRHGLGLREFLVSQDRQFEFQEKNFYLFEKLLPFAISFGVASIWAKKFEDIYNYQPDWYQGNNMSNFTTYGLINSLERDLGRIESNYVMSSTTSSTGHSSGFSGGSSGGGGGGGGGGSW